MQNKTLKRGSGRHRKGYDGVEPTSRKLQSLLPIALMRIEECYGGGRPDRLLETWGKVVGAEVASMTRAVSFSEGKLLVKVNNSTLYSLLHNYEKGKILFRLQQLFPDVGLKNIIFRIG